jgi:hypothetical protein
LVGIVMLVAAIVLGIAGAYGARVLVPAGSGAAGHSAVTFGGPAFDDTYRKHGTQTIGGGATVAPSYREPSSGRGGPQD